MAGGFRCVIELSWLVCAVTLLMALGPCGAGSSSRVRRRPERKRSTRRPSIPLRPSRRPADAAKAAAAATKNWTPPRTPWGDPDLQGYYFNHSSYTPLERPVALGDKAFYTEEEALAAFKKAVETDAEVDPRVVHYDWKEYGMDAWQMNGVRPNLRTSLIVDPPDGRIPPLTPEAQKRLAAAAAAARARGADVTTPGLYTRCITGNGGPPRIPGGVTAESQIVQTPGYVVIVSQSNNDVRIIPLDGRPHLPKARRPVAGRRARPLGGHDARRGDDQFQRRPELAWIHRRDAPGRTLHARRPEDAPLPVHGHRSRDMDETLVDRQPHSEDRSADLRVRLPRAELRLDQLGHGHADPGERSGSKAVKPRNPLREER